jgi:hypothetical protein
MFPYDIVDVAIYLKTQALSFDKACSLNINILYENI